MAQTIKSLQQQINYVSKDIKKFASAAETHFKAEFGDKVCAAKEKIMSDICYSYFMTEDEPAFYKGILSSDNAATRLSAAIYCEKFRYNPKDAMQALKLIQGDGLTFSQNPAKQKEGETAVENVSKSLADCLRHQEQFGDDKLFRQMALYKILVVSYSDAWMDFKQSKAQHAWLSLIDFVKIVLSTGKQKKFFNEALTNTQPYQKVFTAMIACELQCEIPLCIQTLKSLINEGCLNPRLLTLAKETLTKLQG